ncbi:MAG: CPA1 family monovalent cation:H+ antiporter [Halioglobus sp.]
MGRITPTLDQGLGLLSRDTGGRLLFGLALGLVVFRMLRSVDNYEVAFLLSMKDVTGGYALALPSY